MSPTTENSWLIEASSIAPVWLKWEEIKKMFKEQSSRVHCIMNLLLYKVVWVKIKNKGIFTFELDINVGPKIIATLGTPILLIVDNSTTLKKKINKYVIHCKLPFNQTLVTGVICRIGCLWVYGRFNYLRVRMQLSFAVCPLWIQNCATLPSLRVLRISRARLHAVFHVYHTG